MYTKSSRYAAICGVLLALAIAQTPASAQPVETGAVFVAIPETFPDLDARVLLIREPGRDVVVLHPDLVTAEALFTGLTLLQKFEERPRPPGRGQMIPVTGFVLQQGLSEQQRLRMERIIETVRERPVASMGRLGPGRWMPVQAG